MTVTVKNIIPRKQAENVQTTQYTASNCKTIIDKFTVTNTSAAGAFDPLTLTSLLDARNECLAWLKSEYLR